MSIFDETINTIGSIGQKLKILPNTDQAAGQGSSTDIGSFLKDRTIDGTKWNKVYPYVLRVGSNTNLSPATSSNTSTSGDFFSSIGKQVLSLFVPKNLSSTIQDLSSSETIVLPISPQNISVSSPIASNLSVTLNGIVEEHNGSPLREITISGTTGITPFRDLAYGQSDKKNNGQGNTFAQIGQDLFGNTINAFNSLTNPNNFPNDLIDYSLFDTSGSQQDNSGIYGTGYWHFHNLVKFIDKYTSGKKKSSNKDKYLVFEMQKDDLYYKCSLRGFTFQKVAGTQEYTYSIRLTAWDYTAANDSTSIVNKPRANILLTILNDLKKVRGKISQVKGVLTGLKQDVNGDVNKIFSIVRESILVVKDSLGVSKTLADFPDTIRKDWQGTILQNWTTLKNDYNRNTHSNSSKLLQIKSLDKAATNVQQSQSVNPTNTQQVSNQMQSLAINNIFNDSDSNVDFFDSIESDKVPVPSELQQRMNDEVNRVRNLDVSHYITNRDALVVASAAIAAQFGVGNSTYNRVNDFNFTNKNALPIRSSQMEILEAINDSIASLNSIIVQKQYGTNSEQNYINFYISLAAANGINLQSPQGKFAVPFPLGASLQSLAAQYLGDASRWLEIAAINGLRSPYVDEDGFTKAISTETSGTIITVPNNENLYVGQSVLVQDTIHTPLAAKIKTIDVINVSTTLLGLDVNATGYGKSTNAFIQAFLPGTVNSGMMIYIPTQTTPTILRQDFQFSPDIKDQTILSAISKIDFMLTTEGDLATTSNGNVRYSYGIANLIQAANLKILTPVGSILQYPNYGFGLQSGTNTALIDAKNVTKFLQQSFGSDQRYSGVLASRVVKSGPSLKLDLILGLPNIDTPLPLSVTLRT